MYLQLRKNNVINGWNRISNPFRQEQSVQQYTEENNIWRPQKCPESRQTAFYLKIAAKCGNYNSWFFSKDTGAPQGDFASANGFTFYLPKSLQRTTANDTPSLEEHNNMQSNYPIVPPSYQIDIDQ